MCVINLIFTYADLSGIIRRCFSCDNFTVTQAQHYLEISFDFMKIMDEDGEDQKLMQDFGKHDKLLSTGLINS